MKLTLPNLKTSGKLLFVFGLILSVMGVSARIVAGTWGDIPLGLLIAGIVSLGLWLLFQSDLATGRKSNWWGRRSTQAGTNALVSTVAVLIILGLINFLGLRYDARLDLTEKKFFSLAPQTQQVLRNLKQPVKVLIFENVADPIATPLLEQYHQLGNAQFSFEFVDPQAQPGLAQKYGVKDVGDIILVSGDRVQPLEDSLSEASLTPAIARVVSDQVSQAYFVQGHGELALAEGDGNLSAVSKALKEKNITPKPLNLVEQKKVPEDANVVIVAGPKRPFLAAEVQMLQTYLQKGGSLLLMLDPETKPGLDSLLQNWGVELSNQLVVDASGEGQLLGLGPAVPLVRTYGDFPITQDFNGGVSYYPLAQAVTVQEKPEQENTNLLFTSDKSWAESNPDSAQLQFNPQSDRRGPLVLGVALTKSLPQPGTNPSREQEAPQSRLVVVGDSDFPTNNMLEQGLNGDVFLNTVTWLSDRPDQILSIRPKEPTNRRLQLTAQTNRIVILLSLFLLPLLAFTAAASLWWQRR